MIMVMLLVATMTAKVMQMAMIEVMVAAMTPGWGARMNCGRSLSLSLSIFIDFGKGFCCPRINQ